MHSLCSLHSQVEVSQPLEISRYQLITNSQLYNNNIFGRVVCDVLDTHNRIQSQTKQSD